MSRYWRWLACPRKQASCSVLSFAPATGYRSTRKRRRPAWALLPRCSAVRSRTNPRWHPRVRLLDRIAVSLADYLAAFTGLPEVRWQVNERMVLQLDGSTARFSVPNSAVVVFALLDEHSIVQLEVRNPAEMVLQYRTEHPGDRTDLAVGVKTQLRPDLWYVLPAALPMQLHTDQPGSSVLMVTARRLPDGTLNDGRGIDE